MRKFSFHNTVLCVFLLAVSLVSVGCTQDESEFVSPIVEGDSVELPSVSELGLNERVFSADVIFRAKLKSTSSTAELVVASDGGQNLYRGLVHFTFDVSEYLKGSGGTEITAFATVDLRSDVIEQLIQISADDGYIDWVSIDFSNPYHSMESALEAAQKWENDRDRSWDDREAIVMAYKIVGESGVSERYQLGRMFAYDIKSKNKVWLPITTPAPTQEISTNDASSTTEGSRYFLEAPHSGASTSTEIETISVDEMKSLIRKLDQWLAEGEGDWAYEQCIEETFHDERRVNEARERGESTYVRLDYSLDSGSPVWTTVQATHPLQANIWLDGSDKDFFEIAPHSNGVTRTKRPLPQDIYEFFWNYQDHKFVPCDYIPDIARNTVEFFVSVTAPEGIVHEAFFDPVAIGDAVGADATNGQLKPVEFDVEGGGTRSISSIEWEDGEVTMVLSPSAPSDGYDLDFIGLDGNVTLSLLGAEATVSGGTITWDVATQPWNDGDLLMLRMRTAARAQPPTPSTAPIPSHPPLLATPPSPEPTLSPQRDVVPPQTATPTATMPTAAPPTPPLTASLTNTPEPLLAPTVTPMPPQAVAVSGQGTSEHSSFESAPTTLDEVINRADIIARVQLKSSKGDVSVGIRRNFPMFVFQFEVLEYLKGGGGDELVVRSYLPIEVYSRRVNEAEAIAVAEAQLALRNASWDDREAIVLVRYVHELQDPSVDGETTFSDRENWNETDKFAITSKHNRAWLPIAVAPETSHDAVGTNVERRYLTEAPADTSSDSSASSSQSTIKTNHAFQNARIDPSQ